MRQRGLDYDERSYRALIHGATKLGLAEESFRLVEEMEATGYTPKLQASVYTILLSLCALPNERVIVSLCVLMVSLTLCLILGHK